MVLIADHTFLFEVDSEGLSPSEDVPFVFSDDESSTGKDEDVGKVHNIPLLWLFKSCIKL